MAILCSDIDRMRLYSSLFSRRMVGDVLSYGDLGAINRVWQICDHDNPVYSEATYFEYLAGLYATLMQSYRCEYVFKNEVVNKILLRHFTHPDTVAFSEFRVNQSIADLAMFNGTSRAYEIKTDYDSDKRLAHQLADYQKLFERCYLVVSQENIHRYESLIPSSVGIISFEHKSRSLVHHMERESAHDSTIDVSTMMRSIRTPEYMNITKKVCGFLPNVSVFEMFHACEELLLAADNRKINRAFVQEIKKRKTNTMSLRFFDSHFRQLCLATNLSEKNYQILHQRMQQTISC